MECITSATHLLSFFGTINGVPLSTNGSSTRTIGGMGTPMVVCSAEGVFRGVLGGRRRSYSITPPVTAGGASGGH